jgi:hypothetical protein
MDAAFPTASKLRGAGSQTRMLNFDKSCQYRNKLDLEG